MQATSQADTPFKLPTLLLLLLVSLLASGANAADLDRLQALAGNGSVMLRSPAGEDLVSLNPNQSLVPASILKIPLAQAALTTLGEDFRFETRFYTNDQGDLLIRGLGDPFLVSEEIAVIAQRLATNGLGQVRRLVMDDTAFEANPDLPVENGARDPYAARTSALAVNFNTVNLAWNDAGELISAEAQTPLTPLARQLASNLNPGEPERINLGSNPENGLRQAQQLFRHFLEGAGINVTDAGYYHSAVTDQWRLVYRHASSRTLRDNLEGMLLYSNNFIANQLFLTLGAQQQGYPATAAAARATLQETLEALYGPGIGTNANRLLMLEGAGLDRRQRVSAAAMLRILEVFRPHAALLPRVDVALAKSGTLTGVYNYAGYLQGSDGLYPFVILTNQSANRRGEILTLLQRLLAQCQASGDFRECAG